MLEKKITFDSFIRGILGIVVVAGILYLIYILSGVLLPFFIACLVAYLIYPLVTFFQYKLKFKSRVLSIFVSLFVVLCVVTLAIILLVPPMVSEFGRLKDVLYTYFVEGNAQTSAIPTTVNDFIRKNIDMHWLNNMLTEENILRIVKEAVPRVWTIVSGSISFLFGIFTIFIILLYIVFVLLDYEAISAGWIKLVPNKYRSFVGNLATDIKEGMNKYFRGQALVASLVGVLFCIGFLIIDFPLAIGLGLFIGALNMVPYLQIIGFVPTILLALLKAADTGQNFWWIMFGALAVFCIVQIIQDSIIVPKVMGKITGLNPAIILLSLSIWGSLMGIVGMIIALPLTTLMLSYYQRYVVGKEKIISSLPNIPDNQEEEQ